MIARRFVPRTFASLVAAFIYCECYSAKAADRPNIILVMTDDQGYGDLGVHGNPVIETPNIDAMAARSATIENFYVCPVCTPTRACLMTGRYQFRTRAFDTYVGRAMMDPEEVTVAELLGPGGYATGIFGKWHLGDNYPLRPQDQGFDEVLVHKGGGIGQPSDPPEAEGQYTDPVLWRNGEKKQFTGYCTDIYFDHAMDFAQKQHEAGKPFFAYIPTNAPHGPYNDVPQDLLEKYQAKDLSEVSLGNERNVANIYAMIDNIDENMGRLFEKLDELGITENTLVIFMCDNGPNSRRYVGNMRGMKGEVLEGGIRSPFYAQWPGVLPAGASTSVPAAHIDLVPTFLAIAGIDPPANHKFDGRNLLPLVEGDEASWPERPLVLQWHRGNALQKYRHFAMRLGDWKLLNRQGKAEAWAEGDQSPQDIQASGDLELYNLTQDPREQNNLADEKPEKVREMIAIYDRWYDDVSTERPNNFDPPRMIIGSDHQDRIVLTKQDWRRTKGDGWGSGGAWWVDVAEAGPYEITVTWKKPQGLNEGTVTVHVGDKELNQQIPSSTAEVTFENVTLPTGSAKMSASITSGSDNVSPHHVIVQSAK